MKALILSGGTGTRLRPLTYSHAKQLIPIANKPILFYIIEKIVSAGIKDIGIIIGDTGNEVRKAVGNGEVWGANITYIHQTLPLGLAHAVKTASGFLGESTFLMILGDNLFSMELNSFIEHFEKSRANTSVLLHKVVDSTGFGVAVVKDEQIEKLIEKPDKNISDLIITGIYLFDNTIFKAIDEIKPSPRGELEITDAIQKLLETGGKVTYKIVKGWWKDTGKLYDILETNCLLLDSMTESDLYSYYSGTANTDRIFTGQNVRIDSCNICGPVIIGHNCKISNSHLGPYVSIGDNVTITGCDIENSIILEDSTFENVPNKISMSLVGRYVTLKGIRESPHSTSFFTGDNDSIVI